MIPDRNNNSKPLSRREREQAARRQSILDAAGKIFKQQGFHNATMAMIAAEAEFGIGTIYQFFPNKQRLFEEVIRCELDRFASGARQVLQGAESWQAKLWAYISYYMNCCEAEPELPRIIMDVFISPEADITSHLMELFMGLYRESVDMLTAVCEEGFRGDDDKIRELAPLAVLGIMHAISDERNSGILKHRPTAYIEPLYQMITKILGG